MPSSRKNRASVTLGTDNSPLAKGLRAAQRMIAGWGQAVSKMGVKIGSTLQGVGRGISGVGRQLLSFGSIGLAAFALPIKAASDMQEVMSKFGVVFGEQSAAMQAWGDDLADQIGRGQKMTREFLAANQDLLVPIGIDDAEARQMSKTLVGLTYDLASFNNLADEDVHRDLQAALTGSGEVMKKYGVIVSEAAVKQEILNTGMDPKTVTEAQKAQARLAIILRGTTAAQGDAARTSGSFANQMKKLKSKLADTAAVLGAQLLPVITPLVTKAAQAIEHVATWAKNNGPLVVTLLQIVAGATALGAALVVLGPAITAVGTAVVAFSVAMGAVIGGVATLVGLLPVLLTPLGLLLAAAGSLAVVAVHGSGAVGQFADAFTGLKDDAMTALGGIKAALAAGDIEAALGIAGAALQVVWQRALLGVQRAWLATKDFLLDVWDIVVANITRGFQQAMNSVETGLVKTALVIERKKLELTGADDKTLAMFDQGAKLGLGLLGTAQGNRISKIDEDLQAGIDGRDASSAGRLSQAEDDLAQAREKLANLSESAAAGVAPDGGGGSAAGGSWWDDVVAEALQNSGSAADVSAGGATAGSFNAFAVRGDRKSVV